MFAIEKDVSLPTTTNRVRERGDFGKTLDMLEVGDSFFAPARTCKGSYAALAPKKNGGKVFKVRAETKDGVAGVRVWRNS